jgi:hypothetical protein
MMNLVIEEEVQHLAGGAANGNRSRNWTNAGKEL